MAMIEKVARAIASSRYGVNPDAPSSSYFADNGKLRNLTMWEQAIPDARAALQAMLEPSEGMLNAGLIAPNYIEDQSSKRGCKNIFAAMIRAALEEK